MALGNFEVIRIVSGRDFDDAGAKFDIDIVIGDNCQFAIEYRQYCCLPDVFLIAFVVGIDGQRGIAEHRFGARGRGDHIDVLAFELVLDVVKLGDPALMFDLVIRQRSLAPRAPVDYVLALVDQVLLVETDEDFLDGFRELFIEREAFARPIAGTADFLELLHDARLFGADIFPNTADKFLPADFATRSTFFDQEFLDDDLRGDAGMIATGKPADFEALQPFPANHDVLQRVVQGVAEMEDIGRIRGGYDDAVGLLWRIDLAVKVTLGQPIGIEAVFHAGRVILLGNFLSAHKSLFQK